MSSTFAALLLLFLSRLNHSSEVQPGGYSLNMKVEEKRSYLLAVIQGDLANAHCCSFAHYELKIAIIILRKDRQDFPYIRDCYYRTNDNRLPWLAVDCCILYAIVNEVLGNLFASNLASILFDTTCLQFAFSLQMAGLRYLL